MMASRRERKVVTVVFCDLVGFTERAEAMDPEDVEALLRPYHERVRSELERHGGTVEKFIGDAVMALFGAPTAHEDDPERAVRAALAIRDFALEEGLELRVGITTGEALVSLDARPDAGEGMASGDVVNTAARLQSAAPINGVIVDETTYRATRATIDYEGTEPVEAKGKSEPIVVWQAVVAHSRFGVDVAHEARSGLVGRTRELGAVRDAFARARHERTPQLVTLVGVPGIGKSRLVYELSRIADADPELITWRQGRCLAYGEGVTLWALGEIVKAQAGIVEQDTPVKVTAKVGRAVEDVLAGSNDAPWVESHLLALVGLAGETELGGDRRGEAFAAWRRFLEAMAEQRPLVLVFEDLHWADEGLLDFVDELVDWVSDVPLLVLVTARPELLERRPGWAGGKLNATTLALQPLSDDQTAQLISRLLARPVLAVESQQMLLERAGGNPLYAEQFAELFLERGSADEMPLPETLQGIIAARLDGLSSDEKELLRDAAVVGKVFWTGALRREQNAAAATLHTLERRGFVRRQKRSSVEGESEFGFAHALVRDVAYGQIARVDRAEKHRRAAEWIESLGRPEDHAEMVAHHWQAALELAHAANVPIDDLAERARLALTTAGDRAFALNAFEQAAAYYGDAIELTSEAHSDLPQLLFERARALHLGEADERERALKEARDALLAAGDRERAAETEAFLSEVAWQRGQQARAFEHLARAEDLLAESAPSASKARVLAMSARRRVIGGDEEPAERLGRQALGMAEELGLSELQAHALGTIALVLSHREGPHAGIPVAEQALQIALEAQSPHAAVLANNLASLWMGAGEVSRAREQWDLAWMLTERLGGRAGIRFQQAIRCRMLFAAGHWDDALELADAFIAESEAGSPHYQQSAVHAVRAAIRLARADRNGALHDLARTETLAREAADPQQLLGTLSLATRCYVELGLVAEARRLALEVLAGAREHPEEADNVGEFAFAAAELGIEEEVRDVIEPSPPSRWRELAWPV